MGWRTEEEEGMRLLALCAHLGDLRISDFEDPFTTHPMYSLCGTGTRTQDS